MCQTEHKCDIMGFSNNTSVNNVFGVSSHAGSITFSLAIVSGIFAEFASVNDEYNTQKSLSRQNHYMRLCICAFRYFQL